jgi:hypothetical protein
MDDQLSQRMHKTYDNFSIFFHSNVNMLHKVGLVTI